MLLKSESNNDSQLVKSQIKYGDLSDTKIHPLSIPPCFVEYFVSHPFMSNFKIFYHQAQCCILNEIFSNSYDWEYPLPDIKHNKI